MSNMEELISKISAKITNGVGEIWLSKIDMDYAYRQAKLSKEASKHYVFSFFGGDFAARYHFLKAFLRTSKHPHSISRTRRQSIGIQNTSLVR